MSENRHGLVIIVYGFMIHLVSVWQGHGTAIKIILSSQVFLNECLFLAFSLNILLIFFRHPLCLRLEFPGSSSLHVDSQKAVLLSGFLGSHRCDPVRIRRTPPIQGNTLGTCLNNRFWRNIFWLYRGMGEVNAWRR
jgi:hypothetical protein